MILATMVLATVVIVSGQPKQITCGDLKQLAEGLSKEQLEGWAASLGLSSGLKAKAQNCLEGGKKRRK